MAQIARGRRLAEIREAIGVTQKDLAPRLNEAARRLGLPETYEYYTVSRNESGTISFEDAAVWLSVAPAAMRVSWEWFVFGDRRKIVLGRTTGRDEENRRRG